MFFHTIPIPRKDSRPVLPASTLASKSSRPTCFMIEDDLTVTLHLLGTVPRYSVYGRRIGIPFNRVERSTRSSPNHPAPSKYSVTVET